MARTTYVIRDGKLVEKPTRERLAALAPTVGAEHKAIAEVTVRQLERQMGRRI